MKKALLYIVITVSTVLLSFTAGAQNYTGDKVRFSNWDVRQTDDVLHIGFDITANGKELKSKEAVTVQPRIVNGQTELILPEILVNGQRRAKVYRRGQALNPSLQPYMMLNIKGKTMRTVRYTHTVRLTPGLDGGDLVLKMFVKNCCTTMEEKAQHVLAEPLRVHMDKVGDMSGRVSWIIPEEEAVKERATMVQAYIEYPVNKYDVRPHFGNNSQELERIDKAIAPLMQNNGNLYSLRNIRIEGYASPEGTWEDNERLALNRAKGFWSYMQERYSYRVNSIENVKVLSHSEDWTGLVRLINEGNMAYKSEVLAIIDRYGIFEGREKRLMDLAGGDPYRFMLKNYFPQLRRMEITFAYEVRSLSDSEAAGSLQTRPGDLSYSEMIRAGNCSGVDKLEVADIAVKQFPEDPVALINASSAALVRGQEDKAWTYLAPVQNDPRAFNNIGVYYWMKGDRETAAEYLRLAIKGNDSNARKNLADIGELSTSGGTYTYKIR